MKKVKQIVVEMNSISYEYSKKIKEIELYEDEIHYFNNDEVFVELFCGSYISEVFVKPETPENEVEEIVEIINQKFINKFQEKMEHIQKMINNVGRIN